MSTSTKTAPVTAKKSPKTKAAKTPKATPPAANGHSNGTDVAMDPKERKERDQAAKVGLTLVHYRILKALNKAGDDGLSYAGVRKATGYYSILTATMRATSGRGQEHEGSMASLGLLKEFTEADGDDRPVLMFRISTKGRKLLEKITAKE